MLDLFKSLFKQLDPYIGVTWLYFFELKFIIVSSYIENISFFVFLNPWIFVEEHVLYWLCLLIDVF